MVSLRLNSEKVKMRKPDLLRIAKFDDYEHEPRVVRPDGLITSPRLALKYYHMLKKDVFFNGQEYAREELREWVLERMRRGKIKPESGLGFAILSEDMLNIARWSSETPCVLVNSLYEFSMVDGKLSKMKGVNIRKEGAFCVWELGVVAHEKEAWKRFLASERAIEDKKTYLEDTIKGEL